MCINNSKIKKFNDNNIKVDHFEDFLKLTDFEWTEHDFYQYFKNLGKIIKETTKNF